MISNLFSRLSRRKAPRETAPSLTRYERQTLAQPGSSGPISTSTLDAMQTDGMVRTALTVKRQAVLAANWDVVPESDSPNDRQRAEFVRESFRRMAGSPLTVLEQAMDAFAKGWSVQESVYRLADGKLWLAAVRAKNPAHFGLEMDAYGQVRGLRLVVPGEAERDLDLRKFVVYAYRASYASPRGRGDLEACHRHWVAKQKLLNAWQLHLEKFAMPTVLGRYQRGLPADEQTAILRALQDLQNNTAIVYPGEIEIATLGGDRSPSSGFMEAIEFHNREIARAILGQTLTTDEGRRVGSLALGKIHLQVLLLQVAAIRRELADVVMTEQVIRPLVELNFGPGSVPRFVFDEPELQVFGRGRVEAEA